MTFTFQVADLASRFYALLLDTIIQGMVQFGALMVYSILITVGANRDAFWSSVTTIALFVVLFVIQFGYFVLFEWLLNGSTPGKAMFGLRAMKLDGSPFTLADSFVRNLVRVFEFLPLGYALGAAFMLFSRQGRRLGDLAARTVVVRTRTAVDVAQLRWHLAQSQRADPRAGTPAVAFRLSAHDIARIEDFLGRMQQLGNAPRMARLLADDIRAKLGETPDLAPIARPPGITVPLAGNPDADFLRRVVQAWRASVAAELQAAPPAA